MQNSPVLIHGLIILFEVYPTWFVIIVKFKAGVLARYKGAWEEDLVQHKTFSQNKTQNLEVIV